MATARPFHSSLHNILTKLTTTVLLLQLLFFMTNPPTADAASSTAKSRKKTTATRPTKSSIISETTTTSSLLSTATTKRAASTSSFLPQKYTLDKKKEGKQNERSLPKESSIRLKRADPLYLWSSLFAGAGSGILASIVCAPLDVLRTRQQVWGDVDVKHRQAGWAVLKTIWKHEGWRGGFRGLGATLITVPLFWSLYFPTYDILKSKGAERYKDCPPALIHCGSAILAGGVADVICNPLFVVRTRLQTESLHHVAGHVQSGIVSTVRDLYATGGLRIFWRGMTASLFGLSHVAVQFPVYEWLKSEARNRSDDGTESPLDLLLASAFSKMCASLLTYPHEVARARMMDYRAEVGTAASKGARLWPTLNRIYANEGYAGFYAGLRVSLLRVVPNCCITFLTYELLLRWSKEQLEKRNRSSGILK